MPAGPTPSTHSRPKSSVWVLQSFQCFLMRPFVHVRRARVFALGRKKKRLSCRRDIYDGVGFFELQWGPGLVPDSPPCSWRAIPMPQAPILPRTLRCAGVLTATALLTATKIIEGHRCTMRRFAPIVGPDHAAHRGYRRWSQKIPLGRLRTMESQLFGRHRFFHFGAASHGGLVRPRTCFASGKPAREWSAA